MDRLFNHETCRVRWISPVGDDASIGGGVARAVGLFRDASVLDRADYASLLGLNFWRLLLLVFRDIYISNYKNFVVHSIFSPYVLLLLILPFKGKVVILPHGELKSEALIISSYSKKIYLTILKSLVWYINSFKTLSFLATNEEEVRLAKSVFCNIDVVIASDLVLPNLPIQNDKYHDPSKGLSLVVVARLVLNKGVSELLHQIIQCTNRQESSCLDSIYLFVQSEDSRETDLVRHLSHELRKQGFSVFIYEGFSKFEIEAVTKTIPNKVAFLSSKFESFSYVLLETLYFEYPPIVWFENELVDEISARKLCIVLPFGYFPSNEELKKMPLQDLESAKLFIQKLSDNAVSIYINFFRKVFA